MSSIAAGTTTTTGYVVTSDSTGALVLKTGSSATTAVTIDTSQNVTFVGSQTLSAGTANGVLYLNGSKAATSGSALVFDGSNLGIGTASPASDARLTIASANTESYVMFSRTNAGVFDAAIGNSGGSIVFKGGADSSTVAGLTEFMRLDSSGNLGLGVTPSSWSLWGSIIQGNSYALTGYNNGSGNVQASLWCNSYRNSGGTNTFYSTGYATQYNQVSGSHQWNVSTASGTAGNAITFTQAMTLDASGNLGVGTTSPSRKLVVSNAGAQGFEVGPGGGLGSGNEFLNYNRSTSLYVPSVNYSSSYIFHVGTGGNIRAVDIDSSGNLLVGATSLAYNEKLSVASTSAQQIMALRQTDNDNANDKILFVNTNGIVGYVRTSGAATTYNTSSDYRLKNSVAPITGALAKVALLKPVTYKWNCNGSDGEGFIAHELAEVVPQCVSGEKDAVDADGNPKYQGIDTSFLVATLTAAIQELKAELDSVKSELATIKGAV